MSSFFRKSAIVVFVLGIGSYGIYAQNQTSKKTEAKSENHISMMGGQHSHDSMAMQASQGTQNNTKPADKQKLAPQTSCPVMGGNIDKSVYVDYKGKRVYFCCTMCLSTFNKDPETYIKKLEAMGQGVETIAVAPVNKKTDTKDNASVNKGQSAPMKGMDHSKM